MVQETRIVAPAKACGLANRVSVGAAATRISVVELELTRRRKSIMLTFQWERLRTGLLAMGI